MALEVIQTVFNSRLYSPALAEGGISGTCCSVRRIFSSSGDMLTLRAENFIVDEVDGTSPVRSEHSNKSMIIGGEGAYIPFPNHSFLSCFGPNQYILLLDCRAERKKHQICSNITYERVFAEINKLPPEVEHLCILIGVPVCDCACAAEKTIADGE